MKKKRFLYNFISYSNLTWGVLGKINLGSWDLLIFTSNVSVFILMCLLFTDLCIFIIWGLNTVGLFTIADVNGLNFTNKWIICMCQLYLFGVSAIFGGLVLIV